MEEDVMSEAYWEALLAYAAGLQSEVSEEALEVI